MSGLRFESCPICEHSDIRFVTKTFDRHYGWRDKLFEVNECKNCKQFFLNPMITEKELSAMYDSDSYYSYQGFNTNQGPLFKFLRFLKHLVISIKPTDPIKNYQGLKILDLGCGSGKYLYKAKSLGADVHGVEIDSGAAEVGNKYDLNIKSGTLIEANYESECFDFVRSNHSFEHLVNPSETLQEIGRITKSGGKVLIGVPNTKSINYKLFGKYWYYFGVPFHPFNYNPKSLKILFEKHGFEVEKVLHNGNYQGYVGSLQILWNSFKKTQKSHEGFINNQIIGVPFHQLARIGNWLKIGDCIDVIATKK